MTLILIKLKITINCSQFLRTIWTCANQNCPKKIHVNNNLVIAISNQFLKLKRNIHASSDIIVRKTKSWNKIKISLHKRDHHRVSLITEPSIIGGSKAFEVVDSIHRRADELPSPKSFLTVIQLFETGETKFTGEKRRSSETRRR